MADDLKRWLNHEPIRARRPTLRQRALKWGQRHKPVVGAGLAVLLMALVLAGYIAWTRHERTLQRAAMALVVEEALDESASWQQQRRLPEALSAARRADVLLGGADVDEALQQRVRMRRADLELLDHLENARLNVMTKSVDDGGVDWEGTDDLNAQMFREAGLDVVSLPAEEAANRIATSTVAVELAAVLDAWALVRRKIRGADDPSWKGLLRVARLADPDVWRTRVREALERRDHPALLAAASATEVFDLAPATLSVLGAALMSSKGSRGQVEAFLREAQRRHPSDYRLNINLYEFFQNIVQPPQLEEVYHFAAVVVAIRPGSSGSHVKLGNALQDKGQLDEAIAEIREALRLNKNSILAHVNLGGLLQEKGLLDEAIAECKEALRLNKDYPFAHAHLGDALREKGQLDEAIAECKEALRLKNDYPGAHIGLGNVLADKGLLDEAVAEYRETLRINKYFAHAHTSLGSALHKKGLLDEAVAEYRETLRINKYFARAHYNLGNALQEKGQLDEAIAEYKKAIRIKKDDAVVHHNLGNALRKKGQPDEAIAEYKEAVRLKKDFAPAHNNLGIALLEKGKLDEAVAECREAIRIKKDDPSAHNNLGNALFCKGHLDEAIAEYGESLRLKPDDPDAHNNLAWLLANCPNPKFRDAHRAITLAKRAVELAPNGSNGGYWNTLGVAHYRAGGWKAAIEALNKSEDLSRGRFIAHDGFFLAMAHWQLGEKEKARHWYDKAVAWTESHKAWEAEQKAFRAEAEELLGIKTAKPVKERPATKP